MRVVVAGMVAGVAGYGGATWAVLQYVLGLRRLGCDVWLVDAVDRLEPRSVAYFDDLVERFGLRDRAALLRRSSSDAVGVPYSALLGATGGADILLNLAGTLRDEALLAGAQVRVYVDLDPAFTQIWHTQGLDVGLDGHDRHVTVGSALGRPGCSAPTCGRDWIPTLPPVVLEDWPLGGPIEHDAFTTVASWRGYGAVEHEGVHYGQRAHSMRHFFELPRITGDTFAPAIAVDEAETSDRAALDANGWRLLDPADVASTPDAYRRFVSRSRAELCIAKAGYVTSGCGWFSDRSACYLASGRPVLAQETGFSRTLPTGDGLLAFTTFEDAVAGVTDIASRYAEHAAAARQLAEEWLDSAQVLERLLAKVCR